VVEFAPTWPGEVLLRITANVPIRERGLLMPPTTTLIVDLERWFRCRECDARKAAVSVQ
jgi:hypothetical protein